MLTLNLPEEVELRLRQAAMRRGVAAEEYIQEIISEHLPQEDEPADVPESLQHGSLPELFAEWAAEDATNDPEEIARRNREFEELKQAMNQSRVEMEGANARKLWP